MTVAQFKAKRTRLLKEAEKLKADDGSFANDEDRRAFDAKLEEAEQLAEQIRTAEGGSAGDDAAAARQAAVTEERQRVSTITQLCERHGLPAEFRTKLIDDGVTVDAARTEILDKLAEDDAAEERRGGAIHGRHATVTGEDEREKFFRGAEAWLLTRAGATKTILAAAKKAGEDAPDLNPGEFRGMTLVDLARECIRRSTGRDPRGVDRMRLISDAFTTRGPGQTTSDFPILLENVMHKVLQAGYATQPDTWSEFCATGTAVDFRPHNRYRTGLFGSLDSLTEQGEFKNKAVPDAEKALVQLATKGNIIAVSRQTILNDDLGGLNDLLMKLGRAGRLSIEIAVYALLAENSGLGPTQADASPLFDDTARGNVTTGAGISVDALDADRVKMAQQLDPWGNEFLDLRPYVLVVPVGLGGSARVINDAQYDPDTANKLQRPNKVRGLYARIVDTPRISGTRRYSFADPDVAPVIEVTFLEGQQSPVLESRDGWRTDGAEMRVRFDFGVKEVDYRGAVTNAGQ